MDLAGTVTLVPAYGAVGLLLWSVLLRTELPRAIKATLTILLGSFFLVTFVSVPAALGWANGEPPPRFKLIAYHVAEPDKAEGSDGAIFLWASDLTGAVQSTPRAYRVEFSSAVNASITKAGEKIRQGHIQIGEVRALSLASGKRTGDGMALDFFDVPDESFPVQ
jgi:hypothetical protein